MSETGMRMYELGYILVPTTPETEVQGLVDALHSTITKAEGTIHSNGSPEFIDLAYTMEKNVASKKMKWNQGYFGWIKFEAAPDALEVIKKALDGNTDLIRYILIKTNVENTVVFKKPKIEAKRELLGDEEVEMIEEDEEVVDDESSLDHEKLPDLESDIADESKEAEEA
jgi:ribosomal protein S6